MNQRHTLNETGSHYLYHSKDEASSVLRLELVDVYLDSANNNSGIVSLAYEDGKIGETVGYVRDYYQTVVRVLMAETDTERLQAVLASLIRTRP